MFYWKLSGFSSGYLPGSLQEFIQDSFEILSRIFNDPSQDCFGDSLKDSSEIQQITLVFWVYYRVSSGYLPGFFQEFIQECFMYYIGILVRITKGFSQNSMGLLHVFQVHFRDSSRGSSKNCSRT